ncbi:HlyD family efflux transporter periplasmic adaptor subunit [Thalassobaculum sp.]|uniref:HlyD family efflux transporter periplasmic adaptor subunit n=1 Tax=Thalassobaculum sp. TaxID=2022740 RepID=UPI0032EFE914
MAMSGLHRDYLASRIEASVAPPGRVLVILPTVFLALVVALFTFAWFCHVVAGQPLVELDPTETGAERGKLARQVEAGTLEIARLETLIGLGVPVSDQRDLDPTDFFEAPAGTDPAMARAAAERLAADWRAMVTDLAVVPILAEREEALASLLASQLVARSEYLEVKRRLVEARHEITVTEVEMARAAADTAKARADRDARLARAESERVKDLSQIREQTAAVTQELVKATERDARRLVVAPAKPALAKAGGIVTQLGVTSVGGVVSAGEALMRIVPSDDILEISATILNRDIGFVDVGQEAVVKLDAFNYLRYGTLSGTVVGLSADAVDPTAAARSGAGAGAAGAAAQSGQNPQAPPSYTARIRLDTDRIAVDGRPVRPTPGMTVDVRTGERRLIEFVLQPALRYASEGLRER